MSGNVINHEAEQEEYVGGQDSRHERLNKISALNARDRDYRTVSDADGEEREIAREARHDQHLRDNYEIGQRRIEELETWITGAISRPAMSREQRLQGLELVEQRSPSQSLRIAVERICPTSHSVEQGQELER